MPSAMLDTSDGSKLKGLAHMNDSTTHFVYRIVCFSTGKVYVGRTKDYQKRRGEHFSLLKRNSHPNLFLQRAFNKYGSGSFYMETIERGVLPAEIDSRERYWISRFDSFHNGFNLTPGGDVTTNCKKPCSWNGIEYESLRTAARVLGITPGALNQRYKKGYTSDKDMPGNTESMVSCVWNGIQYASIREAASAMGVGMTTMHRCVNIGYTCDDDIKNNGGRACVWNGVQYKSVKDAAVACGIASTAMFARLRKGYTCDGDMKRPCKKS